MKKDESAYKTICLLVLALMICMMIMLHGFIQAENTEIELHGEIERLRTIIDIQEEQILQQTEQILQQNDIERKMLEFLDLFQIEEFEVSGYAPLDPDAVEGMCFEGDPNVTYSSEPPVPGKTAAGHISLIGKTVFVEGMGFYRINDIGGAIGEKDLDLVFETRAEALDWGRQDRRVVILR